MKTIVYKYPSGKSFCFNDIPDNINYQTRDGIIKKIGKQMGTALLNKDYEQSNACSCLLWELFQDYINAWNFHHLSFGENKKNSKKHLYFMLSEGNILKVGIAGNILTRKIDLSYEFNEKFNIYKILKFQGKNEQMILTQLSPYKYPLKKKNGKISTECFIWNEEIKIIIDDLINKYSNGNVKKTWQDTA